MPHFSPQEKHHILLEYSSQDPSRSFVALAQRDGIASSRSNWMDVWDGTPSPLKEKPRKGRPRSIRRSQANRIIRSEVGRANRLKRGIIYSKVCDRIRKDTGVQVSERTVRRWGRQMGTKYQRTITRTVDERQSLSSITSCQSLRTVHLVDNFSLYASLFQYAVSADMCEKIADCRRKLQRIAKHNLFVLDETQVRLSAAPRATLTLPGNQPYVLATDTQKYALRYDMIACIGFNRNFSPMIVTPEMRREARSDGVTSQMLIEFIEESIGPEIAQVSVGESYMLCDKSAIHTEERMKAAFQSSGVQMVDVIKIPTASAKRMSPLDNTLFRAFKAKVSHRCPLTRENIEQTMIDCWNELDPSTFHQYYHHCKLMRNQDVYEDCPDPALHQH